MLGRTNKALENYQQLFEAEKKLRNEFYSESARQQHQRNNREWIEAAMDAAWTNWDSTRDPTYAKQMLLFSELSKAQLLLDELQRNLAYSREKNKDTLLEKQIRLRQAVAFHEREAALGNNTANNQRLKQEQEYELSLLQKQITQKYRLNLANSFAEQSADNLIAGIPGGMNVIEYFTGKDHIYVTRVTGKGIQEVERIPNADSIRRLIIDFVDRYFQSGPANLINHPADYYMDANRLYNLLCKGILSEKECMVIPDGILGFLPFDALITEPRFKPDPASWPFVARATSVFHAYSLQTWLEQLKGTNPEKKFTGFFISFDSGQSPIPAVRKEYRQLRKEVTGNFYRDDKATLENFNKNLGRAGVLHISTHSYLQGKQQTPVLQFADKPFFLFELYGKSFQPQLVVLSACRTANGMLAEGEGVISLARGFTASGAGGIMASLWNMNDESTAELISNFYSHLSGNLKPSLALHKAKLEWLGSDRQAGYKLPYYWAGLIYAGNDKPVILNKKDQQLKWLALLAGGIILLAGVFFLSRVRNKNGS
jgi:CHAT domain-containing protein